MQGLEEELAKIQDKVKEAKTALTEAKAARDAIDAERRQLHCKSAGVEPQAEKDPNECWEAVMQKGSTMAASLGGSAEAAMWSAAAANLRAVLEQMAIAVNRNQGHAAASNAAPPPPPPPPAPVTPTPPPPTNAEAAAAAPGAAPSDSSTAASATPSTLGSAASANSAPATEAADGGTRAGTGGGNGADGAPTAPAPQTPNAHKVRGNAADIEAAFTQMQSKDRETLLATLRGHVRRSSSVKAGMADKERERSPKSLRRELDDTSEGEHEAS